MAEKRRGLGRGLGALIPSVPEEEEEAPNGASANPQTKTKPGRPVDVFFPDVSQVAREEVPTPEPESEPEPESRPKATSKPKKPKAPFPEPTDDLVEDAGRERTAATANDAQNGAHGESVSRETLVEVPGASFAEVPVGSIHPNRKQPRNVFDEDDMAELVHSIKEIGMLQPVVVRPSTEGGEAQYELVMGERRWRAAKEADLDTLPAIIRQTSDDDLLRDALLENLHRSELNPLEEAAAYQQLLDDFGCTHDELADRIGRSRPQVTNMLRLMKLPPLVQRRVAAGVLSAGHARALLSLTDQAEMEKLAQRIVSEGLSVRATEEIVAMSDGLKRPVKSNRPQQGARHERLDYLATSLSDRLDTSVKITLGARKGKVAIDFASVDDLNRIMDVLNPSSD